MPIHETEFPNLHLFAMAGLLVTPLLLIGLLRYTRAGSPLANVAAMVGLALTTTFVSGISLVAEV